MFARASYSQPTIRIHSDLVVLHVTVSDRKSLVVPPLEQGMFKVHENGVPQPISFFAHDDLPASIGLVIDNSGSMQRKRADVMAAALAFARASNPLDEFFIVNFNERVWLGLAPGNSFTGDHTILTDALSGIGARGRTALYDAVGVGLDHLNHATNDRRVLVVLSDGGDNSSVMSFRRLVRQAQKSDTVIYTVGLFDEDTMDRNPDVLRRLATVTGGKAFVPDNVQDAARVFEWVARHIREAYTIGYVPTNASRDGKYRTIHVGVESASRQKLEILVRPGYFAPVD